MRQDGLPANGVNAITQTRDGFLWVGTQIGFVRFDGDEFKLFNLPDKPEFRSQIISSLARSTNGGLWFGIRSGSVGFFDEKSGFTSLEKESWVDPAMNVISLREASDGAVWIGTDRGVARWVKGNTNETRFYDEVTGVTSMYEDSHHRVWLGTVSEGLYYWEAGRMLRLPDPALRQTSIFSLAEDGSGQIWVGTPQGLRCYNAKFQPVRIPAFYTEVKTMLVDSHGVLWIGTTGEGLRRYHFGKFTGLRRTDGLSSDNITALYEDHEGNLWVGTRNGLNLLSDVKLPIYAASEGLLSGGYHDVCASTNGGLWTATSRGVSWFNGVVSSNYSSEAGISRFPTSNARSKRQRRSLPDQRQSRYRNPLAGKSRGAIREHQLADGVRRGHSTASWSRSAVNCSASAAINSFLMYSRRAARRSSIGFAICPPAAITPSWSPP